MNDQTTASFRMAITALLLAVGLSALPAMAAGDVGRGESLGRTCLACHAVEADSNAEPVIRVPRLGGQKAAYLVAALKSYRDGKRADPTMSALTLNMSDQDMQDVVAYLASRGNAAADTSIRPAARPDAARSCAGCHGQDGIGLSTTWPTLAGQHAAYFVHALNGYRDGTRENSVMLAVVASLSYTDVLMLAQYYASLDGLKATAVD